MSLTLVITIFSDAAFDMTHYAHGLIGFLVFSLILTVASAMTNVVLFVVLLGIDAAIFFLVGQLLGGWPSEPVVPLPGRLGGLVLRGCGGPHQPHGRQGGRARGRTLLGPRGCVKGWPRLTRTRLPAGAAALPRGPGATPGEVSGGFPVCEDLVPVPGGVR